MAWLVRRSGIGPVPRLAFLLRSGRGGGARTRGCARRAVPGLARGFGRRTYRTDAATTRRIPRRCDPRTDTGKRRRLSLPAAGVAASRLDVFGCVPAGGVVNARTRLHPHPSRRGAGKATLVRRSAGGAAGRAGQSGRTVRIDLPRRQPLRGMPGIRPAPACVSARSCVRLPCATAWTCLRCR